MGIIEDLKTIRSKFEIPAFLKRWGVNRRICEVGVRYGYNLRSLLGADPTQIIGVDHWMKTDNDAENDTTITQDDLEKIHSDVQRDFLYEPTTKIIRSN